MRAFPVAAIFALATSSALAADLSPQPEPVPTSAADYAFNWTGTEFGLLGGADWLRADGSKFADIQQRFKGGRLGAFAGYQYQFSNNIVVGVEGDASYTWNERDDFLLMPSATPEKIKTDWSGSARARVGYAFDNVLLYTTGGWVTTRAVDSVQGYAAADETFQGYTIGAGVDYAFSEGIFARAEYRYNDFMNKTLNNGLDVNLDQHVVNVGLGLRF